MQAPLWAPFAVHSCCLNNFASFEFTLAWAGASHVPNLLNFFCLFIAECCLILVLEYPLFVECVAHEHVDDICGEVCEGCRLHESRNEFREA